MPDRVGCVARKGERHSLCFFGWRVQVQSLTDRAWLQTNAKKRDAALEEVRAAVEELVLAGGHAAELAPRSPDVMQAQAWLQASLRRRCHHLRCT